MTPEIAISLEEEGKKMADISNDCCELVLKESIESHSSLMHEERANEQSANNVLRHSSVRKYNEVDPMESAAVEKILGNSGSAT